MEQRVETRRSGLHSSDQPARTGGSSSDKTGFGGLKGRSPDHIEPQGFVREALSLSTFEIFRRGDF